jgi:hypothetical protein
MEPIVILLTGTINVVNTPNLKFSNSSQRESEYFNAIKKWIALNYPIIFCENSNYHSEKINSLVQGLNPQKFEYLKFTTSRSHLGKGSGEAEILAFVFENSQLLESHTLICKSTGKNFVTNGGNIIKRILKPRFCKNTVTAILRRNLTFADSRFFFFKKEFYTKYLSQQLAGVNEAEGLYFEHAVAKSIHAAMAEGGIWGMLPELPIYEGYYGTDGTKYNNSFIKRMAKKIWYTIVNKAILSEI